MPQAVIMAGGQGERFWPMTHRAFPKYRIRMEGKRSLLQGTHNRLLKVFRAADVNVVTTREHAAFIREELPKLPRKNILIEPARNNTAAAIHLSCETLLRRSGENETVSFFPADHLIRDVGAFASTIRGAVALAKREDTLVTVGIKPAFPATGYGYIEAGVPVNGEPRARRVKRFHEKPERRTAEKYLKNPAFFWNAGIFTWRIGTYRAAMARFAPKFSGLDLRRLDASYKKLPNLSIDYALLERADRIAVFRTSMDWCDMGNWDMMYEKSRRDAEGNAVQGDVMARSCKSCFLVNQSAEPLVVVGLEGVVVVRTPRGLLVSCRGRAEEAALFFKKSGRTA